MEGKFYCKGRNGSTVYSYDDKFIYAEREGKVHRLEIFEGHYYKLRMFNGVPILEIDGLRMQLVRDFDSPLDYAKEVVKALGIPTRIKAAVLDTCMGLGYTAMEASRQKGVAKVVTCEISGAVIKLAQWNPKSAPLFEKEGKISIMHASVFEEIANFGDCEFEYIVHDPPRYSHAPELYSTPFYVQLLRVLKEGGRMFHYVGAVGEKKGRSIEKSAIERLSKAGFKNAKYIARLQGVIVTK